MSALNTVLPKGPLWCNSYIMRMAASLIRSGQLSDFMYVMRRRHFRRGNLWVQLYPRMKTFLLVPRRATNIDVPHPGTSTLISAPRSNQLDTDGTRKLCYI